MKNIQVLIDNFVYLGKRYSALSQKYFGWQCTYLNDKYEMTLEYSDSKDGYRFYFASDSNHVSVEMEGIDIAYFDIPQIEMNVDVFSKLVRLYKKALKTYNKVEKVMNEKLKIEILDEKEEKIKILQREIDELRGWA